MKKLLLYIAEKTNPETAILYLILSQRKSDNIYVDSKSITEKYGISKYKIARSLGFLKQLNLIHLKYGIGNQWQAIIRGINK